jgi:hypothetical protein
MVVLLQCERGMTAGRPVKGMKFRTLCAWYIECLVPTRVIGFEILGTRSQRWELEINLI